MTEQLSFSLSDFLILEECLEVWPVENSPLSLGLQEGGTILMQLSLITCEMKSIWYQLLPELTHSWSLCLLLYHK